MAHFDTGLGAGGLLRLHVNQGAQDIENNRTLVNWSLELINQNNGTRWANGTWYWSVGFGNGWEYLGHGSGQNYNIGAYGSIVLGSGSSWVAHNADGTYLRGFYGGFNDIPTYGWWGSGTASGDWAATTIPRATTPNWSGNFETGVAKTINLPRASSGFTHDVDYSFGSSGWVSIATGAGVTTSWTPPASLGSQIPNASSGTGTIRVTTKSGATTIGSKTATFTLGLAASVVPVVNTVTWDDANTTVKTNIGAFVQNVSQIFGLVTSSGVHGSTIVKEELVVNGVTIPEAASLVVDTSGTITASGKATDSRNRIGTKAANIPVLPYVPPQVTAFEVLRTNSSGVAQDDGSYLKLVLNAAVQSLIVASAQKNAMTIVVKTKPKGGAWTTRNTITPGLTYNTSVLISGGATYPASTSYSVRVEITDKTGSTYIAETTVATGAVTLDLNDTKVGVGKFWEQGALDVAGDIYSSGKGFYSDDVFSGGTTPDHKLVRYGDLPSSVPAGTIIEWPAAAVPTGWLLCDGQAVSRTTYSDLFAIIGVQYGTGNGSTTFNLPDLRGRVPVGFSSSETEFNSLGKKYGTKTHTLTIAQMPSHSHRQNVTAPTGPGPGIRTSWTGDASSQGYDQGIDTWATGGGGAHNNIQPSFAINFIIKVSGGIGEISNTVESVLLNRVATVETDTQMVSHYRFASALTVGTGWSVFSSSAYWQARGDTMTTPGWNNGIVIPRDGIYHIDATMLIPGVTAVLHLVLKLNDTIGSMSNSIGGNIANTNTTTSQVSVSTHYELKAGDVITLALYTATGGTKTINAQGTTFSARLVQPL